MFKYTSYFKENILQKRPYVKKDWCEKVVSEPVYTERQADGRYRFWGSVKEYEGRFIRVVTLEDRRTIHNAFFDRSFKGGKE